MKAEEGYIAKIIKGENIHHVTDEELKLFNSPVLEKFAESIKEMEEYFKDHPEERIEMFGY